MISDVIGQSDLSQVVKGGHYVEGKGIYFRRGGEKARPTAILNSWNVKEERSIFSGSPSLLRRKIRARAREAKERPIIVPTPNVADR